MSTIVPLPSSYLDSALKVPKVPLSRTSHSLSASSTELESSSSPSLYTTFKILQLVNQFRKRVKTRVYSTGRRSKESSSRLTEEFCQAFERDAAKRVDWILGKTRIAPSRKTSYPVQRRKVSKRKARTTSAAKPESDSTAAKKISWLLKALDKSVSVKVGHSLSTVAKSNDLFIERKEDLHIEHNSWKELLPQLVRVTNLLDTLRRGPSSTSIKTFAEDEAVDLSFDDNIVANLEHLLLCLKEQLIRLLIAELRELVRTHVIECQRDQKQHTKELVLEFPDGRHPLSTTWPWSIRPSLAVLWGVCWMFYIYYDPQGNMRESTDNRLIYSAENRRETEQWQLDDPTNQQQALFRPYQGTQVQNQNQYQQNPQYFTGNPFGRQASSPHGSPRDPSIPRTTMLQHHSPVMTMPMPTQPHSQHHQHNAFLAGGGGQTVATSHPHHQYSISAPDQATHAVGGPTTFHSNNAFAAAPPAQYADAPPASVNFNSLPEDFAPDFNFQSPHSTYTGGSWMQLNSVQEQQPSNYYARSTLPPHSGSPAPTLLRVDTANLAGPQPQDILHHTPTPISGTPSNAGSHYGQFLSPYDPRARSSLPMNPVEPPEQQYTTPKSESPVPHALIAQQARKRSHGEMDSAAEVEQANHSRHGSRAGSEGGYAPHPPSGEEDSPGRQRINTAVQRPDPPTNKDGKYICHYSAECEGYTFDRKCEWNKHMDKHDRPYRCTHPDCAKLQGFTYSGGLLRHEREVHGKHGGPKTQLMCNYPDCKRKNKGFTRKENLNEHIRRVHSKESQSQTSIKRDGTDLSAIAGALQEDAETPATHYSESGIEHDESMVSPTHPPKRRRMNSNMGVDQTEVELLRQNNEDLRAQVADMAAQIDSLRSLVQNQQTVHQAAPGQG